MGIDEPFVVSGGYRELHGVKCVMFVAHGQTWLAGYRKCQACKQAKQRCNDDCSGTVPVMARVPTEADDA